MAYVNSSAIIKIEYEPSTMQLFITFRGSGKTYTYCRVPQHVYDAFMAAPSKGTFFNERIRDHYEC